MALLSRISTRIIAVGRKGLRRPNGHGKDAAVSGQPVAQLVIILLHNLIMPGLFNLVKS